ncbi:MAG: hypothetical protein JRE16_08695 [Deltaproteobacteria bacterium]|jgi:hypothetical protein|nr:hypothetical protein [Deltaproteobacteria bacterium]MBW2504631.1 hypothetical protein [Deltaproteobacteria bacterium]
MTDQKDCLKPEEHYELHMCQLKAKEMHERIEELYKDPKFVCAFCGAKVNRQENLCNPKPL